MENMTNKMIYGKAKKNGKMNVNQLLKMRNDASLNMVTDSN